METIKDSPGGSELRRRAEKKLVETAGDIEEISGMSPEKIASLIHELRVHQVELEMQNEELRRIQGELEKTKDRYSHLYDFAPVGYFTVSEKEIIDEVNLTGAAMLGIERSALIGKPFTRFVLREDQDIFYKHRQRLLETETSQSCELRLLRPEAPFFWVQIEATVARDSAGAPLCYVVMRDITERKQMQDELAKHHDHLEELVKKRTRELQSIVNSMSGRENRMAGLKKVIKELRSQLEKEGMEPVADDPLTEI